MEMMDKGSGLSELSELSVLSIWGIARSVICFMRYVSRVLCFKFCFLLFIPSESCLPHFCTSSFLCQVDCMYELSRCCSFHEGAGSKSSFYREIGRSYQTPDEYTLVVGA